MQLKAGSGHPRGAAAGTVALRIRATAIVRRLRHGRPAAQVELNHESPLELLIATILSAQCTDARVNQVTPALFRAYPTVEALAHAPVEEVERLIRSTGFFRAKARSILGCCRELVARHGGQVPDTMEDLTALPGVGRKTANVVLGAGFGIPSGIVVDTHASRVARRLRLTRHTDPVRIERDLSELIPKKNWIFVSIALVLHGRYVCLARRPRCGTCGLRAHCPSRDLAAAGPHRPPRDRGRG